MSGFDDDNPFGEPNLGDPFSVSGYFILNDSQTLTITLTI